MKPKIMMEFRWTCNRRQDMGHQHHTHRPAAQETAARAWPFPFLDKDVTPKRTAVYFTVSSMGMFLLFPSFFRFNKDYNRLLPAHLPGRRIPTLRAAANTPPDPMYT